MPSPSVALSPSQLAADLAVRDLTDPRQGRHAIQLLVEAAADRLAAAWGCQVRWHRGPRVVPVEENYDRLPPQAVARLGIDPDQKNVLVRVVLRHLERTLTDEEANRLRDRVYAALHRGRAHQWAAGPLSVG